MRLAGASTLESSSRRTYLEYIPQLRKGTSTTPTDVHFFARFQTLNRRMHAPLTHFDYRHDGTMLPICRFLWHTGVVLRHGNHGAPDDRTGIS